MNNKLIPATEYSATIQSETSLYKDLWHANTTALLHAPREVDKTAFALEIIADLNYLGHDVIYVKSENSLDRNVSLLQSCTSTFILTPQFESPDDTSDYADLVIRAIEEAVESTDVRCFVVDSVSRIAALSFGRNASPAYVMKRLVTLQKRLGISMLVIAHDRSKSVDRSILTLADSEILMNDTQDSSDAHVAHEQPKREFKFQSAREFFESVHATPIDPALVYNEKGLPYE